MSDNPLYVNLEEYGKLSFLGGVIAEPNSEIIQDYIDNLECSKENIGIFRQEIQKYNKVSWIDELFVDSRARRSGIGGKLIAKFENFSIMEKSKVIFCEPDLDTKIGLDNLILFYERQGFEYNQEYILNKKEIICY